MRRSTRQRPGRLSPIERKYYQARYDQAIPREKQLTQAEINCIQSLRIIELKTELQAIVQIIENLSSPEELHNKLDFFITILPIIHDVLEQLLNGSAELQQLVTLVAERYIPAVEHILHTIHSNSVHNNPEGLAVAVWSEYTDMVAPIELDINNNPLIERYLMYYFKNPKAAVKQTRKA